MAKAATKAVKKQEEQLPAYINQDKARGNDNIGQEDIEIPRLILVQANSKQTKKSKDEYIEGASPGDITNSLTKENYGPSIRITPIMMTRTYAVWVDRKKDANGGYRGRFDTELEAMKYIELQEDGAKLEVNFTHDHLVILDNGDQVMYSAAKSKLRSSKKMNTFAKLVGGDRFGRAYSLSTFEDSNENGEFHNFAMEQDGFPSEEIYLAAESMYEMLNAGEVTVKGHEADAE